MRTGKMFAAAATALALIATPVMAAPGNAAPGLSMSKALAGAPLRAGTSVRKGENLRGVRGEPVLLGLIALAVVGIVVAASSGNDSPG